MNLARSVRQRVVHVLTVLALSIVVGTAGAQEVTLKNGHPERYIVQKGDTLWDISARFLNDPWMWKKIWRGNPRIQNPDLIYPGDIITLVWVDGQPQLQLSRDALPVVKLSPKVIPSAVGGEITTVPLTVLKNFFMHTRVTTREEMDEAPYILKPETERVVLSMIGDRGFVRGLPDDKRRRFGIYRQGTPYKDPVTDEILGYEAFHLGDAILERYGDPSVIRMATVKREISFGDRLLDPDTQGDFWSFEPEPVGDNFKARIISVVDGVTQVSRYNTVVIDKGTNTGLKPGAVMGVYRDRPDIEDPLHLQYVEDYVQLDDPDMIYADEKEIEALREKKRATLTLPGRLSRSVSLPSEQAGIVMVFRAYERVSYALVMESFRPLVVGDRVGKPVPVR